MEENMTLYEKLSHIQNELNAPKNLFNKFGKYYYRNAESILECAKPLCAKYRTTLLIEDCIEYIEGRFYVKATATLCDWDDIGKIKADAYARECDKKTGMDDSQLTGSCSSYARKYALNGLFNIDDVKDSDSNEQKEEIENKDKATPKQIELLKKVYTGENLNKLLEANHIEKLEDMQKDKASELIGKIYGKEQQHENTI